MYVYGLKWFTICIRYVAYTGQTLTLANHNFQFHAAFPFLLLCLKLVLEYSAILFLATKFLIMVERVQPECNHVITAMMNNIFMSL